MKSDDIPDEILSLKKEIADQYQIISTKESAIFKLTTQTKQTEQEKLDLGR
jgi:hypothetical protein